MNLESLRLTAQALLTIDAKGALVPHGIGGLARTVIEQFLALTAPGAGSGDVHLAALGQLETGLAFIAAGENEESRMAARLRTIAAQALAHEPTACGGEKAALFPAPDVGLSRNKEALLVVLLQKIARERVETGSAGPAARGLSRDRAAILAMVGGAGTPQGGPQAGESALSAPAPAGNANRGPAPLPGAGAVAWGRADRCRPENYADGTSCATCGRSWGYDGPDECPLDVPYGT